MVMTFAELRALSDEEIMSAYDKTAERTIVGLNYWTDELSRRTYERLTLAALEEAPAGRRGQLRFFPAPTPPVTTPRTRVFDAPGDAGYRLGMGLVYWRTRIFELEELLTSIEVGANVWGEAGDVERSGAIGGWG